MYHQHSLQEILEDYLFLLNRHLNTLVWKYDFEPEPHEADFSFTPIIPNRILEKFYEEDSCTLCARRISYKADQFSERNTNKIPLLILLHNVFLAHKHQWYHEPESDREFQSLLKQVSQKNEDDSKKLNFLIRETLRCHFGAEEVNNREWSKNCQIHIQNDINKYSIKGIWIVGEAAPLLFQEKEELTKRMKQVTHFMGLPTVVTHGPSRIVFMRKKKYPEEKIEEARENILKTIQNFKKSNFSDRLA